MMFRHVLKFCATAAICIPLPSQAQQAAPPPLAVNAQLNPSYQHIYTLYPKEIHENELRIYKLDPAKESYNYIPYAYFNWPDYEARIARQCENGIAVPNIRVSVELYWPQLIDEISSGISKFSRQAPQDISFSTPAYAGIVAYVLDLRDTPILAINELPLTALLSGLKMAPLGSQPSSISGLIQLPCSKHREILKRRGLTALMFSSGVAASIDKTEGSATLALKTQIRAALESKESKIDRTMLENEGKSHGLSFKLFGFSFGQGGTKGHTSTTRTQFGVINRNWLGDFVQSRDLKIDVDRICSAPCPQSQLQDKLFDLFFGHIDKEWVRIQQSADQWHLITRNNLKIQSGPIAVDEKITHALNSIFAQKDKSEGGYGGFTFKKDSDGIITLDSNAKFEHKGESWFPISINAYVIDTQRLEAQTQIRLNQIVLGDASQIAIQLPTLSKPPLKAAPPDCPSLAGVWYSAGNDITQLIGQVNCTVSATFTKGGVHHSALGRFDKEARTFKYKVTRRDPHGCVVTFYGHVDNISPSGFESHVTSTNGLCGFSPSWREDLVWVPSTNKPD
jgi:hypothetical protein